MALIVALMSVMLLTALGLAVVMTTMSETMITTNYRESAESVYAADAGIERVMQDVLTVSDWNRLLQGGVHSSFVDGAPGARTLPDGTTLNLNAATNVLNCNSYSTTANGCSTAAMDARTPDRPYGPNNPRWQLFAYSPLNNIIETATVASPMYVVVWVADDTSENDNNPMLDGGAPVASPNGGGGQTTPPPNAGAGVLLVRAEAFGSQGAHTIIETTIARTDTTELERGYTGQRGQDEQNRRARKAAVQTPGQILTRSDLNVASTTGGFTVR
jgi:hypothetical protein